MPETEKHRIYHPTFDGDLPSDLVRGPEPKTDVIFETELKPLFVVEYRDRLETPDRWDYDYHYVSKDNAFERAKKEDEKYFSRQYRVRTVLD